MRVTDDATHGFTGTPTPPPAPTAAVVGAGASGLLTAMQLVRRARAQRSGLRVVVVDPAPRDTTGIAYSTRCDEHLMNVRAGSLSAFADDPGHFVRWLGGTRAPVSGDDFVPRRWFGEYLRTTALEYAGGRDGFERVDAQCIAMTSGERTRLTLDRGGDVVADHVVLALGNAMPPPLSAPSRRVVENPWSADAMREVRRHDDVVVVGSGLTAVDVALTLDANRHRGPITMVSTHGALPGTHTAHALLGTEHAAELFGRIETPTARTLMHAVRRALDDASTLGLDWRVVVDGLRPHTVRFWHALDDTERARLLRHARHLWEPRRHRMAPAVAARVHALVASGRLRVISGRVLGVQPGATRVEVTIGTKSRGGVDADVLTLRPRHVVNCTGPERDITRRRDPLVQQLLRDGLARPGFAGMGLDVDEAGRVIARSGNALATTVAVGPIRLGSDWETTAIPEIRAQAADVAAHIVDNLPASRTAGPVEVGVR